MHLAWVGANSLGGSPALGLPIPGCPADFSSCPCLSSCEGSGGTRRMLPGVNRLGLRARNRHCLFRQTTLHYVAKATEIGMPFDSVLSLLGVYSKEMKQLKQKKKLLTNTIRLKQVTKKLLTSTHCRLLCCRGEIKKQPTMGTGSRES